MEIETSAEQITFESEAYEALLKSKSLDQVETRRMKCIDQSVQKRSKNRL